MVIKNALVHTTDQGFVQKDVFTDGTLFSRQTKDSAVLDGSGCYLIPGLIDIHFHGCAGYYFCDGTPEALDAIGTYELSCGVTSMCPASMTLSEDRLSVICKNAAAYHGGNDRKKRARLCGINLEGPFISMEKKGAQNPAYITPPSVTMFHHLQEAAGGLVKLITLAPETEHAIPFIEELSSEVHISLGHTACDYDTAKKALSCGADHLTHLYNAMPAFSHRAPGLIGAAADSSHAMAEIICDGIHIHPSAVRAAFRLFGDERMIFISDSMMATGMEDGSYALGGLPVHVKGHYATLSDGTLAGSATNLMDCMKMAVSMGIPLDTAVKCATINPARSIGVADNYGSITVDKTADCLLLDQDTLSLKAIVFEGELLSSF